MNCCYYTRSIALTLSGNNLIAKIPENTFNNGSRICLCLGQDIPSGVNENTTLQIQIGDNTTTYGVYTCKGNAVYGDMIRSKKLYPMLIATDSNMFVITDLNTLCRTRHNFAILPNPTPSREVF